jgi:hypothetical protein
VKLQKNKLVEKTFQDKFKTMSNLPDEVTNAVSINSSISIWQVNASFSTDFNTENHKE